MSNDDVNQATLRLRVTLPIALNDRIQTLADTLGLSHSQALVLALAFGTRMMGMVAVNPMDSTVRAAVNTRVNSEVLGAVGESGLRVEP